MNRPRRRVRAVMPLLLVLTLSLAACAAPETAADEIPVAPVMEPGARDAQLQAVQEQAEDLFHDRFPNEAVPDAALVRAVAPSEWPQAIATCMTDAGFESHAKGTYVEYAAFPAEQELAQAKATYQCRVGYPIDPVYQQPYTTDEAAYLYRYLVETLIPCLEGEGISVADAPSAGTFEDQLSAGQEWNPFDSVSAGSDEQYAALVSTCPTKPVGFRGN